MNNWNKDILRIGPFYINVGGGPDNTWREFAIKILSFGPESLRTGLLSLFVLHLWVLSLEIGLLWSSEQEENDEGE